MKENTMVNTIIISMIVIIVGIGLITDLKYNWTGFKDLSKIPQLLADAKIKCLSLNATWDDSNVVRYDCYDYDSEGYRFYWTIDDNGRWYKIR